MLKIMLRIKVFIFLIISVATSSCSVTKSSLEDTLPQQVISSKTIIAIQNVTIIPIEQEEIEQHRTVILNKGRIQQIGTAAGISLPDSAVIIDGSGKYLLPGLLDMHVHIHDPATVGGYLAYGITTVRNMWGTPTVKEVTAKIETGDMIGPAIYSASPGIDGNPPVWEGAEVIEDPDEAPALVKKLKAEGWLFLKIYNRLEPEVYHAIANAARAQGIRFLGHVPVAVPIEDALQEGQASIEHLTGYDQRLGGARGHFAWIDIDKELIPGLVKQTKIAELWNCPTLVVLDALSKNNLPDDQRKKAEANRFIFVKALYEEGTHLLAGTDSGLALVEAGHSLHEELHKLVQAGIPPFEVLKIATLEGAKFLGAEEEIGSVSVGKQADLILLSKNPLENIDNISSIEGVFLDGAWLPELTLKK